MVEVFINGDKKEVGKDMNVAQLLKVFSLPSKRVAVELNKHVVNRKDWDSTQIKDNDRIEIVHFVGGG